ncbi:MAG: preprotein translocase subunit SecG [Rhodocyclales bacterium]|nr:preprotein translocase subunit SecG [Rhodocyclales bacterium]
MGSYLFSVVLTIHVLVGLAVIGLVLMQHGKGADAGAAFGGGGGGASGSVFGSSGSANFLSRTTAVLAATFFVTSLGLAYLSSNTSNRETSVMEGAATSTAPAAVETERSVEPLPADDSKARDIPK